MRKTNKPSAPALERDNIPRATITLTDESVYLTRHDRTGAPAATYPVSAAAVANAFNLFGADTGLLPPNALFWQNLGGQLRLGIYVAPGKRTLHIRTGKRLEHWTIPLPGFVFVGSGKQFHIYAVPDRPTRETDRLYHTPLPIVYSDGKVCTGDVPFPAVTASTLQQAVAAFFDSEFNHDLAGADTINLLKALRDKRQFPTSELRPAGTLADVIHDRQPRPDFGPIGDDDDDAHGIDGIDPYELAYNGLDGENDED